MPAPTGLGPKAQKFGKRKLCWQGERERRSSRGGHLDHRFVCGLADREVEEAERRFRQGGRAGGDPVEADAAVVDRSFDKFTETQEFILLR